MNVLRDVLSLRSIRASLKMHSKPVHLHQSEATFKETTDAAAHQVVTLRHRGTANDFIGDREHNTLNSKAQAAKKAPKGLCMDGI